MVLLLVQLVVRLEVIQVQIQFLVQSHQLAVAEAQLVQQLLTQVDQVVE